MNNDNYPDRLTIRGEGPAPLPALRLGPPFDVVGLVMVLVAVAVVGYGLFGMVRQLTPDASRILIASIALVLLIFPY